MKAVKGLALDLKIWPWIYADAMLNTNIPTHTCIHFAV